MLFLSRSSPPQTTLVFTRGGSTLTTRKLISPLLSSIISPQESSSAMPAYETETIFSLPTSSSVVNVKSSPSARFINPFSNVFMRYSGPFVSSIIAMGSPSFSRTFFIRFIFSRCSACVPCEKLSLATFIPARHICDRVSSFALAGPIVHTILVFLIHLLRKIVFILF